MGCAYCLNAREGPALRTEPGPHCAVEGLPEGDAALAGKGFELDSDVRIERHRGSHVRITAKSSRAPSHRVSSVELAGVDAIPDALPERIKQRDPALGEVADVPCDQRQPLDVGGRGNEHVRLGARHAPGRQLAAQPTRDGGDLGGDNADVAMVIHEGLEPRLDAPPSSGQSPKGTA